jgi:hypothetical protein
MAFAVHKDADMAGLLQILIGHGASNASCQEVLNTGPTVVRLSTPAPAFHFWPERESVFGGVPKRMGRIHLMQGYGC